MNKGQFLKKTKNFFYAAFPFILIWSLRIRKDKILKGLENLTSEELEGAGTDVSSNGKIFLRGIAVAPIWYIGGGCLTQLFFVKYALSDHHRKAHRFLMQNPCIERQRAFLLDVALTGGI